ncbi:ABC transporter permease [Halobacteriales archaeon QS_1_68_20]|nr:MAG: ABC transporter permease [Halobacteriales archaeon QS_1_68_20]
MADLSTGSPDTWTVRSIVVTMFPLLVALSALEMGSGFVLEELQETYLANPTLLIVVPVMIGMGGNLGAILSARLSTQLHLGTLTFDLRGRTLWTNVAAVFSLAVTVFVLLGLAAWVVGHLVAAPMEMGTLLTITVVSGLSLTAVVVALSVSATYVSYRLRLDPDDTTIPVVTNVGDILGVVILSGVAVVVL